MSDLTGGRYPNQSPIWGFTGNTGNVAQSDLPAITTLAQVGSPAIAATGAGLITKEVVFQPAFLPEGYPITEIGVCCTSEATATTSHFWIAVYTGAGAEGGGSGTKGELKSALVGQSADKTTLEPAAESGVTWFAMEKAPIIVSPTNAPHGYVYIGVYAVATTIGKYLTATTNATKVQNYKASSALKIFPWMPNMPLMAFKSKPTAEEGTAEATIKEVVDVTVAPVLFIK
jgi:hypothetical protein